MKKMPSHSKTLSIAISFAALACACGPKFPKVELKGLKQSQNKYYDCEIVDQDTAKLSCKREPKPFSALPDGGYWMSAETANKIRNSYLDAKKDYDKLPVWCKISQ